MLAGSMGILPLKLMRTVGESRQPATSHPIYRRVTRNPNPWQTAINFKEMMQGHLLLRGNAFAQIVRDTADRVLALVPLHPDRIEIQVDDNGNLVYVLRRKDGTVRRFLAREILHIRGLSPDGIIGYAPIELMKDAVGLSLATQKFGSRFFNNAARPSGILVHPQSIEEEAEERIRESWQAAFSGDGAHSVAIMEEGMQWVQLGISNEQSQFLETRNFQIDEVARVFNIPPHKLKKLDKSTFNNIEHQSIEYVVDAVTPWAVRWEEQLALSLLTEQEQETLFFKFSLQALLRGDNASRSQFYRELFNIGVLSINEIRMFEDLNAVEDGDSRFVPLNMSTLQEAVSGVLPTNTDDDRTQIRHEIRLSNCDPESISQWIDENRDAIGRAVQNAQLALPEPRAVSQARRIALRQRQQVAYRRIFTDAGRRVVKREVQDLRRLNKVLERHGLATWRDAVEKLYVDDFAPFMLRTMEPVVQGYADIMGPTAADEVAGEPTDLTEFVQDYTRTFTGRHISSSTGQIASIVRDEDPDNYVDVLNQRYDEWEEKRPGKIGHRESVQAGSALAIAQWTALGVGGLVWVSVGKSCPLCQEMDGRTVSMGGAFLAKGDTVDPGGDTAPLTTEGTVGHPQLHEGCDCMVAPQ
jgi:HK97 family phage portal protein